MSAIDALEKRLAQLKQNQKEINDELFKREKSVIDSRTYLSSIVDEINEYESAITLLKEELQRTVEKNRSESNQSTTTIVGDETCEVLD